MTETNQSFSHPVPSESEFLRQLYMIRFMLARPLQTKILPSFIPVIPLPYLRHVPFITLGQVLLVVPWILIFVASYKKTFSEPDLTGGGSIASYAILAAFLTASKSNSVFSFLFGLSFERMVPIHNLYACLALITSFFHGYVAYVHGEEEEEEEEGDEEDRRALLGVKAIYPIYTRPHADYWNQGGDEGRRLSGDEGEGGEEGFWEFLWENTTNVTGTLCTACVVTLVLLSFFRVIRKYLYEPWLISHILCSLGVMVFGILHNVILLLLPLGWWMLDGLIRYGVDTQYRFPTKATITKCADDLVEVRFPRTFVFQAGQYVRICIPVAGTLQFHPITISSSPFQKDVTLIIRALGGWSEALVELASSTGEEIDILVEGPYGNMSMELSNEELYSVVLCISGGIGVTPCESVARQLIYEAEHGRQLSLLRFVWAVQDTSMVEAIPTVGTDGSMKQTDEQDHALTDESMEQDETVDANDEVPSNSAILKNRYISEIYLTRAKDMDGCGPQFRIGRPDIPAIIQETIAVAQAKGALRVAVITCGPEAMVDNVKDACRRMSSKNGGPTVDVHDEIFNY